LPVQVLPVRRLPVPRPQRSQTRHRNRPLVWLPVSSSWFGPSSLVVYADGSFKRSSLRSSFLYASA
jgi:hypothetical protein